MDACISCGGSGFAHRATVTLGVSGMTIESVDACGDCAGTRVVGPLDDDDHVVTPEPAETTITMNDVAVAIGRDVSQCDPLNDPSSLL